MAGMTDDNLKTTLALRWKRYGPVIMDSSGKLGFPEFGFGPSVYRFAIEKSDGTRLEYIGETDNLYRRFAHYRNPGPTQTTNKRMNAFCKTVLSEDGRVGIDVGAAFFITANGDEQIVSLFSKNNRRLFEYYALVVGRTENAICLNL
jgi:hypothetical protein